MRAMHTVLLVVLSVCVHRACRLVCGSFVKTCGTSSSSATLQHDSITEQRVKAEQNRHIKARGSASSVLECWSVSVCIVELLQQMT
jgi:hypothetical protein